MAVDRSTVLENAQRLAARGQLEKAIEEWSKLAAESPTDGTVFNTIGDLQLKRNAPLEAIEAYFRAASAFQQRGFALKTIAVYKKILKIDPNRFEVYRFLGDLNAERGLIRNAIGDYLTVARFYLKEGNNRKALELYRSIVKIDPTNLAVRQRVAELCVKEKLTDEAIAEYLELAKASLAQQRSADAQQAYRAILQIDPAHREAQHGLNASQGGAGAAASAPPPVSPEPELKIEPEPRPPMKGEPPASQPPDVVPEAVAVQPEPIVAQAETLAAEPEAVADVQTLLDRATRQFEAGRYQEAELLTSQALAGEPGNSEGRQLLALIKLKKGDLAAAKVDIESIVEAALRDQDYALAESALRHYLSVDPKCVSLLELLGQVFERNGDPMSATIQYGKAIEALLEHPQAERATLPAELYAKIKAISPDSPLVARFAEAFGPSRLPESPMPLPTEEKPPVLELEIGYHHPLPAQAPPVGRTETDAQRADETPTETAPEEAPGAERKRRRISYL